ncbi:adenylate cyclase, partial [Mesorhizobium sp. M8A.F.Ca.ET.213.01.1.1]
MQNLAASASRATSTSRSKADYAYTDLGSHQVHNIVEAVRAYRVSRAKPTSAFSTRDTLTLPEKPSIAVLPFDDMSGDPEQGYFADGMVEEIITALSRTRWLFVIARNSSFTYKGRAVDIK